MGMLAGKVAPITGAGRGAALTMKRAGAAVVVNDPGASRSGDDGAGDASPAEQVVADIVAAPCSDAGKDVAGQVFDVHNRKIYLFSQPRPIRTEHIVEGWRPEAIAERVFDQFANDFHPLHNSGDVFSWDPV